MYVICVIVNDRKEKKINCSFFAEEKAPANCELPCWLTFLLAGFLVLTVAIIICLGVIIKKRPGENKVSPDEEEVQIDDFNLAQVPQKKNGSEP